jgi:predicted amidohydrolase
MMAKNSVRVACVQIRAFDLEEAAEGLRNTLNMIDRAAADKPDLLVLPEATYPAYFLRSPEEHRDSASLSSEEILRTFGGKAAEHGVHLVVGLALEGADGRLGNAAALFGPDGSLIGRYDKSFLWQFDRRWFEGGRRYPVFDTAVGRLGLLVCADGRLPEIARCLALAGAQIIVDVTAWVSWGRQPDELTNPQREYMMSVRALENGVWVVAADKVGVEAGSIAYCGRSCVIDPQGGVRASASADREEVLLYEIPLESRTGVPVQRRPHLYGDLVRPTADLPVVAMLEEPLTPQAQSRRLATVAMPHARSTAEFLTRVERHTRTLRRQDADVIVFPEAAPSDLVPEAAEEVLAAVRALSREEGGLIALTLPERRGGALSSKGYLLAGGEVVLAHRQTHLLPSQAAAGLTPGDEPCPVLETAAGRVGLLVGAEGLVPEVARCLMLRGAELLLWPAPSLGVPLLPLARCRADENRLYLAVAAPSDAEGALIVSPAGQVIAATLLGEEMSMAAQVNLMLSRWKDMATDTNVVLGRLPETYGLLVSESA